MIAPASPRARAPACVLFASLAASAAAAQPSTSFQGRVVPNTVSAGLGVIDTGFSFADGAWAQLFLAQQAEVRWPLGSVALEGSLLHALPASGSSATRAFTAQLRAGWATDRFTVAAGPSLQYAPEAQPWAQWLPTARAQWAMFERLGLSAGVFDIHALAPFRISLEAEHFGAGYVAPLGAEVHARLPFGGNLELHLQGLALRIANATIAALLVSGAWAHVPEGRP